MLNEHQFRGFSGEAPLEHVLSMPSLDAQRAGKRTVADMLPEKRLRPGQDRLKNSISRDGLLSPVKFERADNGALTFAQGHHRVAAAQDLGWKTIAWQRSDPEWKNE